VSQKRAEPQPGIVAEVATALSWPPADYSAAATWCPHCAFPLTRSDHHRNCVGYIVGAPGMPLCECPCNAARREAAAKRRPDPLYDQPRWWQQLAEELARPAWKKRLK
jgi:hypothetical protein